MAQRGCLMITTTKIIIMTIMMVSLKHSTPVYNCKLSYSLIPALYLSRKDTLLCYTVLPKCFLCGLLSGWNKIYTSSKISSKSYLKKYLYHQSQNSKTWDSKCLALIAQMVRTFSLNPKVGGSSPLRSRHFLSQNIWNFHKNTRPCVENESCFPGTVNISNVNFT